jgi:hypothetical protein
VANLLTLDCKENVFYEHPESFSGKNIELQECAVIAINFVRGQS